VHADISSYCLWYNGRQVIVDPGISTYTISPRRNLERGTPIHNTLSIAGLNQSDVWGGFRVGKRAQVSNIEGTENHIGITIRPFFNRSCLHQRTFIKLNDQSFIIEDRIEYPSSSTRASIGGIQFAKDIHVQYRQNVLKLDGLSIQVRGVDTGELNTTDYGLTYHQFQTGLRFEYQGATSSSFTFQFR
jgi:hypothetical protein